jgi:hypothetical protein
MSVNCAGFLDEARWASNSAAALRPGFSCAGRQAKEAKKYCSRTGSNRYTGTPTYVQKNCNRFGLLILEGGEYTGAGDFNSSGGEFFDLKALRDLQAGDIGA